MIVYDSSTWGWFLQWSGSVFPAAFRYSAPSAFAALLLKFLDGRDYIALENWDIGAESSLYSGFTYVLGFVLVFRTSQSYARYWTAATSVHRMSAEWFEAAASLIAFAQMSRSSRDRIKKFEHQTVRLFGLLHAMALEEIATMMDENFPLIDIEGLRKEDLAILASKETDGRKMEIVYLWVKMHIMNAIDSGLMRVPPPILTRVFQNLASGQVQYQEAQQVVIWPFPFPYSQMCCVLVGVHMCLTPLIVCLTRTTPVAAFSFTLISVMCMKGLDLISVELENPFGDDANDLPTFTMHAEFNADLLLLLDSRTWKVPELNSEACMDISELNSRGNDHNISLMQYQATRTPHNSSLRHSVERQWGCGFCRHSRKAQASIYWAQQRWGDEGTDSTNARLQRALSMPSDLGTCSLPPDANAYTKYQASDNPSTYNADGIGQLSGHDHDDDDDQWKRLGRELSAPLWKQSQQLEELVRKVDAAQTNQLNVLEKSLQLMIEQRASSPSVRATAPKTMDGGCFNRPCSSV